MDRNKTETGVRYEWYALQRWGADYWEEFERPKLSHEGLDTTYLCVRDESLLPREYIIFFPG